MDSDLLERNSVLEKLRSIENWEEFLEWKGRVLGRGDEDLEKSEDRTEKKAASSLGLGNMFETALDLNVPTQSSSSTSTGELMIKEQSSSDHSSSHTGEESSTEELEKDEFKSPAKRIGSKRERSEEMEPSTVLDTEATTRSSNQSDDIDIREKREGSHDSSSNSFDESSITRTLMEDEGASMNQISIEQQSVGGLSHFQAMRFMRFKHNVKPQKAKVQTKEKPHSTKSSLEFSFWWQLNEKSDNRKGSWDHPEPSSVASQFVQKAKTSIQKSYSLFGELMESEPNDSPALECFHSAIETKLLSIVSEQLGKLEEESAPDCLWTLVFLINKDLSVDVVLDMFQQHFKKDLTTQYRIGLVELFLAITGQLKDRWKQFNTKDTIRMINDQLNKTRNDESEGNQCGNMGLVMNRNFLIEYLQELEVMNDEQHIRILPQGFDIMKWNFRRNGLDPKFVTLIFRVGSWESIKWMHRHFMNQLKISKIISNCCREGFATYSYRYPGEMICWMVREFTHSLGKEAIQEALIKCCWTKSQKTLQWLFNHFKDQHWRLDTKVTELAFQHCCQENNLETIQWMLNHFKYQLELLGIQKAFQHCCQENNLEIIQWMSNQFKGQLDTKAIQHAFLHCCLGNNLETIQWMHNQFQNHLDKMTIQVAFLICCKRDDSSCVKWMQQHFKDQLVLFTFQNREDTDLKTAHTLSNQFDGRLDPKEIQMALLHSCLVNNFKDVQQMDQFHNQLDWMTIHVAFLICCKRDDPSCMQWISIQFKDHLDPKAINWAIRNSPQGNNLETVQWMFNHFKEQLDTDTIRSVFCRCFRRDLLETAQWIWNQFRDQLDTDTIRDAFSYCCMWSDPEILQWICNEFEDQLDSDTIRFEFVECCRWNRPTKMQLICNQFGDKLNQATVQKGFQLCTFRGDIESILFFQNHFSDHPWIQMYTHQMGGSGTRLGTSISFWKKSTNIDSDGPCTDIDGFFGVNEDTGSTENVGKQLSNREKFVTMAKALQAQESRKRKSQDQLTGQPLKRQRNDILEADELFDTYEIMRGSA